MEIANRWTNHYKVYSFLCDSHGRLQIPSIAKFLQESAWEHAEHCGAGYETLKPYGLVWILHGLKIKIADYPLWGESLSLETWGKNYEALFAYRDFEISKQQNPSPIIKATSSWLMVNAETHRPVRITDELKKIPANPRIALTEKPGEISLPDKLQILKIHEVVYSDIDIYKHVNNTSYIRFCIDAINDLHCPDVRISAFEIKFLQEVKMGESLQIFSEKMDSCYYFQGMNSQSNKEIFRARAEIIS